MEHSVRQVTIYEFTRTSEISYEGGLARFRFRVKSSKGTLYPDPASGFGSKLLCVLYVLIWTRTSVPVCHWKIPWTIEEVG